MKYYNPTLNKISNDSKIGTNGYIPVSDGVKYYSACSIEDFAAIGWYPYGGKLSVPEFAIVSGWEYIETAGVWYLSPTSYTIDTIAQTASVLKAIEDEYTPQFAALEARQSRLMLIDGADYDARLLELRAEWTTLSNNKNDAIMAALLS